MPTITAIDFDALAQAPRLLMECELKPLQGDRFQPTGFADLGPALYTAPRRPNGWTRVNGDPNDWVEVKMLLVESAQSVANHLESAIWDEANDDLIPELKGLPYVRIDCGSLGKTNSIKEFHRLNSPYIWSGEATNGTVQFREAFVTDCGLTPAILKKKKKGDSGGGDAESVPGVLDFRKFYNAVFKYDPNSVIHGLFLEKVAGRLRMPRLLSGFIEASHVSEAASGGTKFDHVLPSPKVLSLSADDGYGNVPFPRSEFTAREIKAYFNLDLALLRGYGLPAEADRLLIALSLLKIQRFIREKVGVLRTACKLEPSEDGLIAKPLKTPNGDRTFTIPSESALLTECENLIKTCAEKNLFSPLSRVEWKQKEKPAEVELPLGTAEPSIPDDSKADFEWVQRKGKKGPKLKFKKALNEDTAGKAKAMFPGNTDVEKAIDEALAKHSGSDQNSDNTTENGDGDDA